MAVVACRWAGEVVATDINPAAVRAARNNAVLNGRGDKIRVEEGDLFSTIGAEPFDVILFNPPYYRGEPRDVDDHAWRGQDVDARFAEGLSEHLAPRGHALLCLSSDGDARFVDTLKEKGFDVEVVAERDLINEIVTLYRVQRGKLQEERRE